jgi:hypothetical protein
MVEGESHDSLAAEFGEQRRLDRYLTARAAPGEAAAAQAGVLSLTVFPHN